VVFENGKEVFRMAPAQKQAADTSSSAAQRGSGTQSASSIEPEKVMKISPAAVAGNLLHRVEPEYPEAARQQRIQGAVVVDVHIGRDGAVQDVQTISGPPLLAQASLDAVKQWRFKPRSVNGRPTEMQTRITLNFRLPQ
jgi:TonB family protein